MIQLSPYHEIFYNEWKLNPNRHDYNIVIDNEMQGEIDPDRLSQALGRLSRDYFLLHSNVKEIDGLHYWVARLGQRIEFDYFEDPLGTNALLTYVRSPFDLTKEALLRVALVKLSDKHFRIVMVVHHMIMDSSKEDFICETFPQYYNDETYRIPISIEEQRLRLKIFSDKYSQSLKKNEEEHQQFWRNQLTNIPGVDLVFLKATEKSKHIEGNAVGEYLFTLNTDVLKNLKLVAKKYATTPYLLSLSCFAAVLFRHNHQQQMGLCLPIAIPEGDGFIYGSNVSPSVFTFEIQHATTLSALIRSTKKYFKDIKFNDHYHYPLQRIFSKFINKGLMDVAFTQTNLKNIHFNFEGTYNEKTNTSLNIDLAGKLLIAQEIKNDQIYYRAMYQKQFIDKDLLMSFIDSYQRFLILFLDDLLQSKDDTPVSKYNLINEEQRQLMAYQWNETEFPYPNKTLHQLFEEQVAKTPNAVAMVFEEKTWTYEQLNQTSNKLANYLRSNFQIKPDHLIGLCFKPGHHMIVSLWATLKSGAAYVPIDPSWPDERIHYLLDDTKMNVVIIDKFCANRLNKVIEKKEISVINLDRRLTEGDLTEYSNGNLTPLSFPHHLAYVIYTSGTQGKPKGVMIEQRSLVNYAFYVIRYNQLSEITVGAQYAAFTFDCSAMETYPIFFSGGKLCIIKDEDRTDCSRVNNFFHEHKVTYAFLPTSFAELFFDSENRSLKNLMICGEKLNKSVHTPYKVINAYGPTEATVQATTFSPDRRYENIPIGKPLSNVKCYVVDSQMHLMPIGTIGELLIGGVGLARKYFNQPDLTEKYFISNPFQSEKEQSENRNRRLYKTGDLVRWLPDGNLEYIGRNDDQTKIRGHRIESDEIEYRLLQHPEIQQATVKIAARFAESNEKYLIAYYVAPSPLVHSELKEYLATYLPPYMVPAAYVYLEKMPLTSHGKLDKNSLPSPQWDTTPAYEAPRNSLENFVCSAYAKVLEIEKKQIGIHHNFFDLGGDSLSAIRLTITLSRHFKIDAADVFRLKTPVNLVSELSTTKENLLNKIEEIKRLYKNKISFSEKDANVRIPDESIAQTHRQYLEGIKHLDLNFEKKKFFQSVLLTGSTGFLGCHILATLLAETTYTVYLPIRADSNVAAFERLNAKFKFYFSVGLENKLNRVKIFTAHLDKKNLGLETEQYENLSLEVNSIIHCASLVKYFGHAKDYLHSNIQPTINLLELASLTKSRDFHYISTTGVLLDGYIQNQSYGIFNEDDNLENLTHGDHPYVQSKYQAEQLVRQYRLQGINGSIYRVGNLVMNSRTHKIQENFEENMLFAHIKAMMNFKIVPEEIARIEVSPVDCTASAIVKLFDKSSLANQTYHVYNPHTFDLSSILKRRSDLSGFEDSFETFIEKIIEGAESGTGSNTLPFCDFLYQFWLGEVNGNHSTCIKISQNKTEHILSKYGFQWPVLTSEMFREMLNKAGTV